MKVCNCSKCCLWRAVTARKIGIGLAKKREELWWGLPIGTIMDLSWNNPYAHKGRERE